MTAHTILFDVQGRKTNVGKGQHAGMDDHENYWEPFALGNAPVLSGPWIGSSPQGVQACDFGEHVVLCLASLDFAYIPIHILRSV